jgi:flagellar basal-body rod modification protein FlgD
MRADLQQQINPTQVQNTLDLSAATVAAPAKAVDSNAEKPTDFGALLQNSNDEVKKERDAKANGNFSGAKTNEDFLEQLSDATKIKPSSKNDLDKNDFLKLFVTQLQNQDPLNPDDGAEMASKLAQFNSVEQMMNANKKLEDMNKNQNTFMNQQLVHYLGKEVTIEGGKIRYADGDKAPMLQFGAESDANQAKIEVRDSNGQVVSQIDVGVLNKGQNQIPWNPVNAKGEPINGGLYTYTVTATKDSGEETPIKITTQTRVTGVDLKDGKSIKSDLGDLKFTDVVALGLKNDDPKPPTKPTPPIVQKLETAIDPAPQQSAPTLAEAAGVTAAPADQAADQQAVLPEAVVRQGAVGENPNPTESTAIGNEASPPPATDANAAEATPGPITMTPPMPPARTL